MTTHMKTLACQHVGKVWTSPGGLSVAALRDIEMTVESGEVRRHPRSEWLRQEHAAGIDRGPRAAVVRPHHARRKTGSRARARRGDGVPGHSLFPWLSVKDNVGFGLAMKKGAEARARRGSRSCSSACASRS
jgi:hypothetical protein